MDHLLDAVVIGAKIKRLGANLIGVKLFAYVSIDADVALTWQTP
jgi:hypothetical protein